MKVVLDTRKDVKLSLMPQTKADAIVQQLYIIIQTVLGEAPMYRQFGTNHAFKDMPMIIAKSMYIGAISDAIEKFMPEATLVNVFFDNASDYGDMMKCSIEVMVNE
jgi:phage baseplate assembly protein W